MPQPTLSISYFSGTVTGVSGAFASSEINGTCFWSITVGASTPDRPDVASGAGSLIFGNFPRDGNAEQQISGIFTLPPVTVDTPLYFHLYQTHDDGDSAVITEAFSQDYSVTADTLVVSTDANGLNLDVNFDYDIGIGSNSPSFYFVIAAVEDIDNAWADAVRLGLNEGYGPPLYASGDLAPGPGSSFSLSGHDLVGIQAALTEGVTYGIGIAASDARSIQNFIQPTKPVLTTTFVASFAPTGPTIDSVNDGLDVVGPSGAYARIYFEFSGFASDPTSARIYDSLGGTYDLTGFSIESASRGRLNWLQMNLRLEQQAYRIAREGIAFTAPNNAVTFELTNGTETASLVVNYLPTAGRGVVELITPLDFGPGSIVDEFTDTILDFDQVYYPSDIATVTSDGILAADTPEGSTVYLAVYDQTDNFWKPHAISFPSSLPASFGGFGPTVDEVLNSSFLHYSPIYTIDNMSTALMVTPEPGKSRLRINEGQLLDEPQLLFPGDEFRFYVRLDGYNSYQTNTVNIEGLGDFTSSLQTDSPAYDFEPDPFSFPDAVTDTEGVEYTASMTISGLGGSTSVSIDKTSDFVAGFSINGTRYTQTTGRFAENGDVVEAHVTAGADGEVNTIGVHIGGITQTFTVRTVQNSVPVITMLGDNPVTVTVTEGYTDPGATAFDFFDGDLTASIVVTNSVDTETVGQYSIIYDVTNSLPNTAQETRIVNVINFDTTPDDFDFDNILGVTESTQYISSQITVQGVRAGLPIPIIIFAGEYNINGGAFTSSAGTVLGGQTVRVRRISSSQPNTAVTADLTIGGVVGIFSLSTGDDVTAPVITLNGASTLSINLGDVYTELGYSAIDNIDGDITNLMTVSGTVDGNTPGTYVITYTSTDTFANTATAQRTVFVVGSVAAIPGVTIDLTGTIDASLTFSSAQFITDDRIVFVVDRALIQSPSLTAKIEFSGASFHYEKTVLKEPRNYQTQISLSGVEHHISFSAAQFIADETLLIPDINFFNITIH